MDAVIPADLWQVHVDQSGSLIHVRPVKGLMSPTNWALSTNPRRTTSFWPVLTASYIRREFPKNEAQLRKAIALCEKYCRRYNEHEREIADLLARASAVSP